MRYSSFAVVVLSAAIPLLVTSCDPPAAPVTGQSEYTRSMGAYGVQSTEVTVSRQDGSTFPALMLSPAVSGGEDTSTPRPMFPAIVFGHGFLQSPDAYASTLDHLVSQGYIVIATRSGMDLLPDSGVNKQYAKDLSVCFDYLQQQTQDPQSQWYQEIDMDRVGLLGNSMGGSAAVRTCAADQRFRALATTAATELSPSSVAVADQLTVPSLFMVGTADTYFPPEHNSLAMYAVAPPPRIAVLIEGGYHCGFLDGPFPGCDSGPLARADQLAITREKLEAFFDCYLADDPNALDELLAPMDHATIQYELQQ